MNPFMIVLSTRLVNSMKGFMGLYSDWTGMPGEDYVRKIYGAGREIDEIVKQNHSVLILFYAPWCKHCKAMKPEFAKAASIMGSDDNESTFAAVDCEAYPQAIQRFSISVFPTLKHFQRGYYSGEYSGTKDSTGFVEFMTTRRRWH